MIDIREPRWHDRTVLIATYRVKRGINKIIFTEAKKYLGKIYELTGEEIFKCPIERKPYNTFYIVPLSMLRLAQESPCS